MDWLTADCRGVIMGSSSSTNSNEYGLGLSGDTVQLLDGEGGIVGAVTITHPAPPVIPFIPPAANAIPIADNEADAAIRTGQVGTSTDYAREDHNHPIRRQANPGDPVITVSGATSTQQIILDRFSDEESYSYRFRVLVTQSAGVSWGIITIPSKAGFQQPKISEIGGYRTASNAPQDDDTGNGNGFGASPRGPYMGENPSHWSSTNRLYMPHYRRDNAFSTYVGFTVTYVRT